MFRIVVRQGMGVDAMGNRILTPIDVFQTPEFATENEAYIFFENQQCSNFYLHSMYFWIYMENVESRGREVLFSFIQRQ